MTSMTEGDIWDKYWPECIRLSTEITRQEQLAAQQNAAVETARRALRDYINDVGKKIALETQGKDAANG